MPEDLDQLSLTEIAILNRDLDSGREKEVLDTIFKIVESEKQGNRQCGQCTLCCKLIPVEEINKPKGTWCRFSRSHKGCTLYPKHPLSCKTWSCEWLKGVLHEDMYPYTTHCVVDPQMEVLTMQNNDTGQIFQMQALQIWVDPKFPNAWREGRMGEMIKFMAEKENTPTIIRTPNNDDDFTVGVDDKGEFFIRKQETTSWEDPDLQAKKARVKETIRIFQRINPTPMHQEEPIW
jgi:hypothetical protein